MKKLKVEAMENDNKTSEYLATINDISSRLHDLLNNTQHSSQKAENAKSTIKRLKAVDLNKLKVDNIYFSKYLLLKAFIMFTKNLWLCKSCNFNLTHFSLSD